jgi:peptidoglycan/xylan/chitin deacetylase (PgdA/CDA1 family)
VVPTARPAWLGAFAVALAVALAVVGRGDEDAADPPSKNETPGAAPVGRGQHADQRGLVSSRRAARAVARLRAIGRPVYCGAGRRRLIALTFDDGPGLRTRLTVRILRRFRARATFFAVGKELLARKRLLDSELPVAAVGNHSFTHSVLTRMPVRAARWELERTRRLLARSGARVDLFRPPYGARSPRLDRVARKLGLLTVMWSMDSLDTSGEVGWRYVSQAVMDAARPGSIVLLHENQPETPRALERILAGLRRKRLRPVTVPELLALDPPRPWQLRRGRKGCR